MQQMAYKTWSACHRRFTCIDTAVKRKWILSAVAHLEGNSETVAVNIASISGRKFAHCFGWVCFQVFDSSALHLLCILVPFIGWIMLTKWNDKSLEYFVNNVLFLCVWLNTYMYNAVYFTPMYVDWRRHHRSFISEAYKLHENYGAVLTSCACCLYLRNVIMTYVLLCFLSSRVRFKQNVQKPGNLFYEATKQKVSY